MPIDVHCYAGSRYPERPLSFTLKERTFRVERVLDQWFGPQEQYFKVLAEDQRVYLLKYSAYEDVWTLEGMFPPQGHLPRTGGV